MKQLTKNCDSCQAEFIVKDDTAGQRRKTCGMKKCLRKLRLKTTASNKHNPPTTPSEPKERKKFSEERKEEYKKKFAGTGNPRFGAELTEETRKKISEALLGKKPEKKYEKQCEACKETFFSAMERTRFCNWRCNYRFKADQKGTLTQKQRIEQLRQSRKTAICQTCNQTFHARGQGRLFCSKTCQKSAQTVSCKKYQVRTKNCKWCEKEFSYSGYREKLFCSCSCKKRFSNTTIDLEAMGRKISATQKETFASGKRIHSWLGRNHSDETKAKISKQHTGKYAGALNPMYGKTHSPDACAKISEAVSKNNCIKPWLRNKSGHFNSTKTGLTGIFRSSWEELVFKYLEAESSVVFYKSEPFRIPYILENKKKHYVPDFLVEFQDGRKLLLEIKPKGFLNYDINLAKFAAGRQYCGERGITYEVWSDEKISELKKLGL